MKRINKKFEIGQIVYFNLMSSEAGRIINYRYWGKQDMFDYHVSFGPNSAGWYSEEELSDDMVFENQDNIREERRGNDYRS